MSLCRFFKQFLIDTCCFIIMPVGVQRYKLVLSQQRNDASTVWQFAQLQQYRFSIINVTRH